MAERGRSYAWALRFQGRDPEIAALSEAAREGWIYACELAENARTRMTEALTGEQLTERLTLTKLARDWGEPVSAVRSCLRATRIELFGRDLTDRAIRHRLRSRGQTRKCKQRGCTRKLTWQQPAHRRYCDDHHSPAARTRRHRQKSA